MGIVKSVIKYDDDKIALHENSVVEVTKILPPGYYCLLPSDDYIPKLEGLRQKPIPKAYPILPCNNLDAVQRYLKVFLSKDHSDYCKEIGIKKSTGILLFGEAGIGKCLAKGTEVIMLDGTFKKVEDIVDGDKLIGPDSKARNVTGISTGSEEMFKIIPNKGESFTCNKSHILSLKDTITKKISNISVKDYLELSKTKRKNFKLYHTSLDFKSSPLPFSPYSVGVWLAEGSKSNNYIYSGDHEVIRGYVTGFSDKYTYTVVRDSENCHRVGINYPLSKGNPWRTYCREHLIQNNEKRIPKGYLITSRENRLKLLAGILDGDGSLNKNSKTFEICCKDEGFSKDLLFLGRSLGFRVTIRDKEVQLEGWDKPRIYKRLFISGHTENIPNRVDRKNVKSTSRQKDPLVTRFKVKSVGQGDYYGFCLDKDHLFCLSSFIVSHNTNFINDSIVDLIPNQNAVVITVDDEKELKLLPEALFKIRQMQDTLIIVIFEEFEGFCANHEAQVKKITDGNETPDNSLFFATTNYVNDIPKSIKDRKSRFKYCLEIKMSDDEKANKKWLFETFKLFLKDITKKESDSLYVKCVDQSIDDIKDIILDYKMDMEKVVSTTTKTIGFNKK